MNWELIIPTAISLGAVWYAATSKSQAKKIADEQLDIQKRMEINQFYPIIEPEVKIVDDKVELTLLNQSDANTASEYEISYVLRVSAKNMSLDCDGSFAGSELSPKSSHVLFPEEVNVNLTESLPFILRTEPSKLHIVLRFWIRYKANHPDSRSVNEDKVVYLTHKNGSLTLISA